MLQDIMTHYPVQQLHRVLPQLSVARPPGSPLIIAVDGGSGSGKSTLAKEWAGQEKGVVVVPLDDFYLPVKDEVLEKRTPQADYEMAFDRERIKAQLLEPLRSGHRARYQVLDWELSQLGEWATVEPRGLVVVEGVYSHRPEWQEFMDLKIWVEVPQALRRKRAEDRGENTRIQLDCWQAAEAWYVETFNPMQAADVVVDGRTGTLLKKLPPPGRNTV